MARSRTNPEPGPSPGPEARHAQAGLAHEELPRTQLASSAVACTALALALGTAAITLGSLGAWRLEWLSEREMVFALVLCLGGSILTGTVAAGGWMHAKQRRDGGTDPIGRRRSVAAGVLAGLVLVGVVIGIEQLGGAHSVGTDVPPPVEIEG